MKFSKQLRKIIFKLEEVLKVKMPLLQNQRWSNGIVLHWSNHMDQNHEESQHV